MNKTEFNKKISEAEKPLIVDFWAEWCGPCKMTKPILEKLAAEYAESVEFLPIDADESADILKQYQVLGIPTVLAIRDGVEVGRITGAQNEANYRRGFEALIEGDEIETVLSPFDRNLRIGGGMLLLIAGIAAGSWLLAAAGVLLAFLGVYDRCPVWKTITSMLQRN